MMLGNDTAQKMKFSIKDLSSKCGPADLVTFNGEILNGKLHFLCSVKPKFNVLKSELRVSKNVTDYLINYINPAGY